MKPINLKCISSVSIFGSNVSNDIFDGLILLIIFYIFCRLSYGLYVFIKVLNSDMHFVELRPRLSDKPIDTSNLIRAIYGLQEPKSVMERLFKILPRFCLEIVGTPESGINYILGMPESLAGTIDSLLRAQFDDLSIVAYVPSVTNTTNTIEFGFTGKSYFPLKPVMDREGNDALKYILTNYSELKPNESIGLQIILKQLSKRNSQKLQDQIYSDRDTMKSATRLSILSLTLWLMKNALKLISKSYKQKSRKVKSLSIDTNSNQSVLAKLSEPLFEASLRISLDISDDKRASAKLKGLIAAINVYSQPPYQYLYGKNSIPNKLLSFCYNKRLQLPTFYSRLILNTKEISGFYHFPSSIDSLSLGIANNPTKFLAISPSLRSRKGQGIYLGENTGNSKSTRIKILKSERKRHIYILGGTGTGKTTLIKNAVLQDVENNEGVTVVDPHGDLADSIIKQIPEKRLSDVIYLNPSDINYPIGINLLELDYSLPEDELLVERDFVTESIVSLLRKIFTEDEVAGHRIEYILRNTIHTAFKTYRPTIFTVYRLLTDYGYRKQVVSTLDDYDLRNFWVSEFGQAGGMQRVKMTAGVTAKLGRFLRSESARRILEQKHSTIDFEQIINTKKILICNLSKGKIGEDTSNLLGLCVLTKLQLAAYKRQYTPQRKRGDYYIYVDEFQNFATKPFVQLLSESRKYGLCMTLAEQSLSQQNNAAYVNTILANIGTLISFRSNSPQDEATILPLFKPYLNKGDIHRLDSYGFYCRISAIHIYEPFSGSVSIIPSHGSSATTSKIINISRKNFTHKYLQPTKDKPLLKK
jgi:hypothetical protein